MTKPEVKVMDSWGILALVRNEEPAAAVRRLLLEADSGSLKLIMSWVNAGEVYYMLCRKQSVQVAETFLEELPTLPIQLVLPTADDFISAARLKATRRISYADGFAAALAIHHQAPVVTGDPELREMADVLTLEWIGAQG